MNRLIIRSGIAIGIINFAWLVTEFLAGLHDKYIELFFIITPFSMLVPIIGLGIFFNKAKKYFGADRVYIRRCLPGFSVTMIFAAISAIGQYCYHQWINPGFFDYAISLSENRGVKGAESYFNTASYVIQVFFSNAILGILATFLFAAIFRQKKVVHV